MLNDTNDTHFAKTTLKSHSKRMKDLMQSFVLSANEYSLTIIRILNHYLLEKSSIKTLTFQTIHTKNKTNKRLSIRELNQDH